MIREEKSREALVVVSGEGLVGSRGRVSAGDVRCGIGVFVWERSARYAGIRETRVRFVGTGGRSPRAFADCKSDEPEHGVNPA